MTHGFFGFFLFFLRVTFLAASDMTKLKLINISTSISSMSNREIFCQWLLVRIHRWQDTSISQSWIWAWYSFKTQFSTENNMKQLYKKKNQQNLLHHPFHISKRPSKASVFTISCLMCYFIHNLKSSFQKGILAFRNSQNWYVGTLSWWMWWHQHKLTQWHLIVNWVTSQEKFHAYTVKSPLSSCHIRSKL